MSFGVNETESETVTEIPSAGREERELQGFTLEAARAQLDQLRNQLAFQSQLFQAQSPEALQQVKDFFGFSQNALQADQPGATALERTGATEKLLGMELQRAASGVATPEQRAAINQSANLAIEAGQSDISRAASEQLQLLRRELAPGLGLRSTDTPITDRGQRIAEEAVRQSGQLTRGVRGAEQQALIDASLRQGALNQGLLGQSLGASADIAQRAFQNRLALAGRDFGIGQLGLGLTTANLAPTSLGQQSLFQADRLAQPRTRGDFFGRGGEVTTGDINTASSSIIGGIGGGIASSRALKRRHGEAQGKQWLANLREIPIDLWSYLAEPNGAIHAGPYAEDFQKAFDLGDGESISFIDAIGVLFAMVKELERRI